MTSAAHACAHCGKRHDSAEGAAHCWAGHPGRVELWVVTNGGDRRCVFDKATSEMTLTLGLPGEDGLHGIDIRWFIEACPPPSDKFGAR